MSEVCPRRELPPALEEGGSWVLYPGVLSLPAGCAHERQQGWSRSFEAGLGVSTAVIILLSTADFGRSPVTQHRHLSVFLVLTHS